LVVINAVVKIIFIKLLVFKPVIVSSYYYYAEHDWPALALGVNIEVKENSVAVDLLWLFARSQ